MAGVNLYALFQLRQLTALSANMATRHYPAIESAKHLLTILYAQLNSEKKYLAVRDATFLQHFDEEVDEFHRGLQTLQTQELTPPRDTTTRRYQAFAARTSHDSPF